jgi:predicted nucleic acid-binding protein
MKWVRDVGPISPVISAWDLGRGETEVLNWSYGHPGCEAILDDRAAKDCALSVSIKIRGTISVVLLAKREGKLHRVKHILDQLPKEGFRIQPKIMATAKKLAGED